MDNKRQTSTFGIQLNGRQRGCDAQGCGHFGAPRGDRQHFGSDIEAAAGENVYAPIAGIVRVLTAVYPNDDPAFAGVEISNEEQEITATLFYVEPIVETGDEVEQGDLVGTTQDRAAADEGMTNHVHVQLRVEGELVDPQPHIDERTGKEVTEMQSIIVQLLTVLALFSLQDLVLADDDYTLESYYAELDNLEGLLESGDNEALKRALPSVWQARILDVPKYEPLVFEAAIAVHEEDIDRATDLLLQFEASLMIDSGYLECTRDAISSVVPNNVASDVYSEMCAEYYLSYYEKPTYKTLRRVSRYWSLSAKLRWKMTKSN